MHPHTPAYTGMRPYASAILQQKMSHPAEAALRVNKYKKCVPTRRSCKVQERSKLRDESALNSWVWKVALNTCISFDRKKKRGVRTETLDMDIDLFDSGKDETRQFALLRERIGRLGPFDRAIVLLWLEDMSYEEIGQIVGISVKNVSVRLVRIKEQLKTMQ